MRLVLKEEIDKQKADTEGEDSLNRELVFISLSLFK